MGNTAPQAVLQFPTPTEFHSYEVKYGTPVRVHNTFKASIPMDGHLREYARSNKADISCVIRHALHEYLQARGFKPLTPA